jgi:lipoteichoic acid synthase
MSVNSNVTLILEDRMKYLKWPLRYPQVIFLLLIFIKFCFVRSVFFGGFRLWDTLYIELPMLIFIFGLVEWIFKKGRLWVYFTINVFLSCVLFATIVYYQYFGSIPTYISLMSMNQAGEVKDSILLLIHPSFWLLFCDLPFILLAILLKKRFKHRNREARFPLKSKYSIGIMSLAFILVVIHALNSIDGSIINEHNKAENMGLLSYQAYVAYADMKRDYNPEHELSLRGIQSVKGIIEPVDPEYFGIARDQDIYIVQLEAINNFLVDLQVGGKEVTPHMNSLIEQSFYFPHVFQQIGKGNTSDAEFITNTSVYTSGLVPLSKQFGNREVPSLPRYLRPYGYESVTLHTNAVHFWDRDLMYPALGFDHYYDSEYFGEEDILTFGPSDEVLYEKSMDIFVDMKSRDKKIYANLIAMSSHGPFEIPVEKNPFPLPAKLKGTLIGKYIQAAHYADYALGQFILNLKDQEMWDTATLLINGDHFGYSATSNDEEELQLAAELLGIEKYTRVEMFNIPLVIRVAGHDQPEVVETIGGQVDFLPTLANLMGLPLHDKIYFGQDLLNHSSNLIPQRIYLPTGSFINDEVMFVPGNGFNDGWMIPLFDRENYPGLEQYRNDFNRALKLVELSDSYLYGLPKLGEEEK